MPESIDLVIQNGRPFSPLHGSPPSPSSKGFHLPEYTTPTRREIGIRRTSSHAALGERYGSPHRLDLESRAGGGFNPIRPREEIKAGGSLSPIKTRQKSSGIGPKDMIGSGIGDAFGGVGPGTTDFFSPEVFQIVLHNPTTAHRFLKFCQNRACGENMEFLEKVEQYHRLLDQITQLISSIHSTYLTPDGISELNLPSAVSRSVSVGVKNAAQKQLPALESIFLGAQDHVEKLLAGDAYHRFVKHQITTSATVALADNKDRFKGLGDCFCLTDPSIADNPILFASDGFVAVTGYSRKDIIPRNCRFLQGPATERASPIRLRTAIRNEEETVELLLNYRKNGDPFWNLLYVAPLYDEHGAIKFFIGGQVDVSTTVHNCTEVLKVLGQNVDDGDERASLKSANGRGNSSADGSHTSGSRRSSFFKSFRSPSTSPRIGVNKDAGMEGELINRVGKMNIRTQIEAFYTAYSKYIVMTYTASSSGAGMSISHYSPGVIDMLCLNLPNGAVAPIFHKDIFKVLAEHSASSSITKGFKQIVRAKLHIGNPVSVELGLLTGYEEVKRGGTFSRGHGDIVFRRTEQKYVSHWTPLKDEGGAVKWVVLTIAPK